MIENLIFEQQVASTSSNLTVNNFFKHAAEENLILRPAFQRNLVWNVEQQSFLIDSILRGLPVPEIYVQYSTTAQGDESIVVVDGQQRISACIRYLADAYRLVGGDELDPRWRNRKFSELEESLQKRFRSFELIVRKLPDLDEPVLREVFRRLNKTVEPLDPQELRHAAYTGPFLKFVEAAAAHPVFTNLGIFSARDYLRRKNDEFIAEISMAVISRAYPNKKEGLDELFLTYEKQGMPRFVLEDVERRFGRVISQLEPMASELRRTRFRNKSDFYSLFVCLAKQAEILPLEDEAGAELLSLIKAFSSLVNDIKKEEAQERSIDELVAQEMGEEASKYLRAVERAASDRLSRVRREEALLEVLGPVLARGQVVELSTVDAAWRDAPEEVEDYENETEESQERVHMQEVLLHADDDPIRTQGME